MLFRRWERWQRAKSKIKTKDAIEGSLGQVAEYAGRPYKPNGGK
jgi:hypothetical protein